MNRDLVHRDDLNGDDGEALWCDMITGAVADFAETAIDGRPWIILTLP
jgi:hypothetical protein